ncbi:MAG: hypothetical protein P8X65_08575 [Syntrophobacterales bacterium]
MDRTATLFMGTFNSEYFLRDNTICKIPFYNNEEANAIISVMDELLFVFSRDNNDLVITRIPMDDSHKNYLSELGIKFNNNEMPVCSLKDVNNFRVPTQICKLLVNSNHDRYFQKIISPNLNFSPYSVVPETHNFCDFYGLKKSFTDIEIVKKVNSKLYSYTITENLFGYTLGSIVESSDELRSTGSSLLNNGPFLLKDLFGVSGIGNILIESANRLELMVRQCKKQEKTGKRTQFLIQPLLKKEVDFSCHLEVKCNGAVNFLSVQIMSNKGFSFSGIKTAKDELIRFLESSDYFDCIRKIGRRLFEDGYHGFVCIDSMILQDGGIVPILEINARKSMGLINYQINQFFSLYSKTVEMISLDLRVPKTIEFEQLLNEMRRENILFSNNSALGIIPLTGNSFHVNSKLVDNETNNQNHVMGRLYLTLVGGNDKEIYQVYRKVDYILNKLNIIRFN